jgi:hypothetical protein
MKHRCLWVAVAAALALCLPRPARAGDLPPPTVFDGAYQGLLVGALAGTATGYIIARDDMFPDYHAGSWKPLIYGAGIGAIAGSVLGLTLGIVDMAQRIPHRNAYVMRDGLYGAGLGAVLGGIAGTLAALSTGHKENILLGGAIGVLVGTCGGMAVGFVEGYRKYSASVAAVQQSDGSLALLPAVVGRF